MADLRVAFWNVQNLFEPNVVDRGPRSVAEMSEKILRIADQINLFFGGHGPDVMALAEVGTESIFDKITGRLKGDFMTLWESPGLST